MPYLLQKKPRQIVHNYAILVTILRLIYLFTHPCSAFIYRLRLQDPSFSLHIRAPTHARPVQN